jgi:splicing factor 3B subunit 1
LNTKAASVAVVMKACREDQLMGHLGVLLYEYLGEEYPEVLGSILGALHAIVNVARASAILSAVPAMLMKPMRYPRRPRTT